MVHGAPEPDDVDGWIAALGEPVSAGEARRALDRIEQHARDAHDWERVVEIVMARVEHAAGAAERARLLCELAEIYQSGLDDPRRAFTAVVAACHVAPDDDAAARAAERLAGATGRWAELVSETAELAAAGGDPALASKWWVRIGGWYAERLGDLDGAIRRYEAAVATDGSPAALEALVALYDRAERADDHLRALERLAAAHAERGDWPRAVELTLRAEAAAGEPRRRADLAWRAAQLVDQHLGDPPRALGLFQRVVELAPDHAAAPQVWLWIGDAARTLGDGRAAEIAFRRVLEREPRNDAALRALIELAEARGDWRGAVELRRGQLDALAAVPDSAPARARLLEQIGDVSGDRLGDRGAQIAAYLQAIALAPGARAVLHKLLEAYTAERQWRRALDLLDQLADHEPVAERRARIHVAAAMIARDELADAEFALAKLGAALDADPRTAGAFDALDALWAERGDGRQRARTYRRQIERLGDAAPAALWGRLGDLCLDELGDVEAATAAYQVAAELAPEDLARREQLAELHLAGGAARRRDAIAELQQLLASAPDRVELYAALAGLYRAEGELDKAWCVAQVLVFLGAASDDDRRLHARLRPARFAPATRRLTDELWRKAIVHPREDRRIGAVFAAAAPAIAADTAQPVAAFGLAPEARADLERTPREELQVPASPAITAMLALLRQAASVLAIDPPPMVWLDPAVAGLRVANTLGVAGGRARAVPSVIVGTPGLAGAAERELAFEVGKRLAYLRPERFAALAVATLSGLEAAFAAVLRAAEAGAEPATADDLAARLRDQLPGAVRAQIGELAAGLAGRTGDGAIAAWRSATDLTANRVGFVFAGELETAARAIATEGTTLSGLPVKDRLCDLLGYAASEGYFTLRRYLGQQVHDPGDAARDAPVGEA